MEEVNYPTTLLCAVCHCDELPLSQQEGYEGLCLSCEDEKRDAELEAQWSKELALYEKRTGQKLDFNEFYYECEAGNVDKENLKRLPEMKSCYEDAMVNIAYESRQRQQLEINFNGAHDLPF